MKESNNIWYIFLIMPGAILSFGILIFFLIKNRKRGLKNALIFSFLCVCLQIFWVWLAHLDQIFAVVPNIFLIIMFLVLVKVANIRYFWGKNIIFIIAGFLHGFWFWLGFCWSERLFEHQFEDILLGFVSCAMVGIVAAVIYFIIGITFLAISKLILSKTCRVGSLPHRYL